MLIVADAGASAADAAAAGADSAVSGHPTFSFPASCPPLIALFSSPALFPEQTGRVL